MDEHKRYFSVPNISNEVLVAALQLNRERKKANQVSSNVVETANHIISINKQAKAKLQPQSACHSPKLVESYGGSRYRSKENHKESDFSLELVCQSNVSRSSQTPAAQHLNNQLNQVSQNNLNLRPSSHDKQTRDTKNILVSHSSRINNDSYSVVNLSICDETKRNKKSSIIDDKTNFERRKIYYTSELYFEVNKESWNNIVASRKSIIIACVSLCYALLAFVALIYQLSSDWHSIDDLKFVDQNTVLHRNANWTQATILSWHADRSLRLPGIESYENSLERSSYLDPNRTVEQLLMAQQEAIQPPKAEIGSCKSSLMKLQTLNSKAQRNVTLQNGNVVFLSLDDESFDEKDEIYSMRAYLSNNSSFFIDSHQRAIPEFSQVANAIGHDPISVSSKNQIQSNASMSSAALSLMLKKGHKSTGSLPMANKNNEDNRGGYEDEDEYEDDGVSRPLKWSRKKFEAANGCLFRRSTGSDSHGDLCCCAGPPNFKLEYMKQTTTTKAPKLKGESYKSATATTMTTTQKLAISVKSTPRFDITSSRPAWFKSHQVTVSLPGIILLNKSTTFMKTSQTTSLPATAKVKSNSVTAKSKLISHARKKYKKDGTKFVKSVSVEKPKIMCFSTDNSDIFNVHKLRAPVASDVNFRNVFIKNECITCSCCHDHDPDIVNKLLADVPIIDQQQLITELQLEKKSAKRISDDSFWNIMRSKLVSTFRDIHDFMFNLYDLLDEHLIAARYGYLFPFSMNITGNNDIVALEAIAFKPDAANLFYDGTNNVKASKDKINQQSLSKASLYYTDLMEEVRIGFIQTKQLIETTSQLKTKTKMTSTTSSSTTTTTSTTKATTTISSTHKPNKALTSTKISRAEATTLSTYENSNLSVIIHSNDSIITSRPSVVINLFATESSPKPKVSSNVTSILSKQVQNEPPVVIRPAMVKTLSSSLLNDDHEFSVMITTSTNKPIPILSDSTDISALAKIALILKDQTNLATNSSLLHPTIAATMATPKISLTTIKPIVALVLAENSKNSTRTPRLDHEIIPKEIKLFQNIDKQLYQTTVVPQMSVNSLVAAIVPILDSATHSSSQIPVIKLTTTKPTSTLLPDAKQSLSEVMLLLNNLQSSEKNKNSEKAN